MRFARVLVVLALPLLAAACAGFPGTTAELDQLQRTKPAGAPFTQALSREYQAFAAHERDEYDWFNSQHFARKGLEAAQGTQVAPEALDDWRITDKQAAAELGRARSRLTAALAAGAPSRAPALSATAQAKFDCWVEEQDEAWETREIEACRRDFLAAMDALEAQGKPPAAALPPPGHAVKPGQFLVFFDFDQDRLTPEATRILAQVAKAAKAAGYPRLALVGFTDLAGSAAYNMRLSLRRAQSVRKALAAAGVPADRLRTEGRGKAEPLVPTKDGVREPQNRRVVVRFPQ